ncbi:MAG: threonine--tRNA ligase, partial [Clostridiales bacterium]|nr:threonine--tRNA ligase [Clostridiales bacterium]
MKITLKDGTIKEYEQAMSVYDIALDISEGLARMACAAQINGEVADLRTVIEKDCELSILTANDSAGLRTLRHTTSHVLAEAVKRLYPNAKLAIGPSIDTGFYYDFEAEPFAREDLDKIEAEMKKVIKEGNRLEKFTLPRNEAIQFMEEKQEPYKVELIKDLPQDAVISFYRQGEFVDLCAGPHLMSTKNIKAFKLISSSGAYWRGKSENAMLQRIYGSAFSKKEELDEYLVHLEDIKKRDHNKLGREMELFATVDVIGQGLPLLMPKGAKMIQTLQRWIEDEEESRGYMRTKTPLMAKKDLYVISDHWSHYKEGMFVLGDEENPESEVFALRPMTCPFQYYVYKQSQKSYRDLPCRYGETSTLFRNEESGEMHGLTRVRQFTISEGHLIVRPDQIEEEFKECVSLAKYCLTTLGLENDVTYRMSKWDPNNQSKYLGTEEIWNQVQDMMRTILNHIGIPFVEEEGEAAFYGPKLDIQAKNVYGKEDTMITIQLDMFNAERFDMTFIDQ